ncbi:MAG: hypothetical protein KKE50_01590 [Nanoarchaeota archaeon]|nr:hypothetical protein [Nanoarchaeota archaeon]
MKREVAGRIFTFTILGLLLCSFLAPFVLAADSTVDTATYDTAASATKSAISGALGSIGGVLSPLFGDKEVLTRVFFAILLYMILYSAIGMIFKGKRALTIIITFLVTAISLLALPSNFIEAIRTQYGAMGAAILSIIPFIIILVFSIKVASALIGRVVWIFYIVYYFALYIYQIATTSSGWLSAETIPYFAAIIAGVFIFFFIGAIRKAWFKGEMADIKEAGTEIIEREQMLNAYEKKRVESLGDSK